MPDSSDTTLKKLSELQSKLSEIQLEISKNLFKASEGNTLNVDDLEVLFKEIETLDRVARHERDTTH